MGYLSIEEALTVGTGIERSFVCPVHDDSNPSASVNSLTGYWVCYTCGAWGKVDLDRMEIDPAAVRFMVAKVMEKLDPVHQVYPEGWLSVYDADGPGDYWLSRFAPETCKRFRLGQTHDRQFATIPMRDNTGDVLGVIGRRLEGEGSKYKYPTGVDISRYLFNYHGLYDGRLILTEGATDAMAAWESGYSAAAIYGSRFSTHQARLIKKFDPSAIFVAFDQDTAGEQAYERVRDKLGTFYPVIRLEWDTYKDLASIPLSERTEMFQRIFQEGRKKKLLIVRREE